MDAQTTKATWRRSRLAPRPSSRNGAQVIRALSDQSLGLYESESLIFVAAVTHCLAAMSAYVMRPEDYRGRREALHRAIDDER